MRQFDITHVDPEMLDVVNEFPKIFLEPSKEILDYYERYGTDPKNIAMCNKRENLVNLRFGFEHDIGWKEIVRGFCKDIQDLCDRAAANGDKFQYKGFIMKEKFGAFTPQGDIEHDSKKTWDRYRDEYYDICSNWERASTHVCEKCGKPASPHKKNSGWITTLCEEHWQERQTRHLK